MNQNSAQNQKRKEDESNAAQNQKRKEDQSKFSSKLVKKRR